MFHHSQGISTGKKDLGGQGLNKGREGIENQEQEGRESWWEKGNVGLTGSSPHFDSSFLLKKIY